MSGSTPYAWDHYDEQGPRALGVGLAVRWRRVGAPPHRVCDEGSIKTSVNKLRKSLRNKRRGSRARAEAVAQEPAADAYALGRRATPAAAGTAWKADL